jgi:hypothetical protein
MGDCHLLLLTRRGIPFGPIVPIHIHVPAVGHLSGHLHAAPRVFRLGVNLCVPTLAVTKSRPRVVDDNYEMQFISGDVHHVLELGVIVISVHRIVTYGVP